MQDARGFLATMATTPYGFTPTQAVVIGSEATLRFGGPLPLPGPFELWSREGSSILRYEEAVGRRFDGLYFEAAEVARRIATGDLESPCRPLEHSLATMATLDAIRRAVGISFAAAGLKE